MVFKTTGSEMVVTKFEMQEDSNDIMNLHITTTKKTKVKALPMK